MITIRVAVREHANLVHKPEEGKEWRYSNGQAPRKSLFGSFQSRLSE